MTRGLLFAYVVSLPLLPLKVEAVAAQSPCLMDSLEAKEQVQFIEAQFSDPDPEWRHRLGLPTSIEGVHWISRDPVLCTQALASLRRVADSLGWAPSRNIYLFRVDPDLYVVVREANLNAISFFDRRWRYLATLVGLG